MPDATRFEDKLKRRFHGRTVILQKRGDDYRAVLDDYRSPWGSYDCAMMIFKSLLTSEGQEFFIEATLAWLRTRKKGKRRTVQSTPFVIDESDDSVPF